MIDVHFTIGSLSQADRALARRIGARTSDELRSLLPALADPVRVHVETSRQVIPKIGIGATAMTPDNVSFRLDPDHTDSIAALLHKYLRPTLFHECHHLVRGWVKRGGLRPRYLIEAVVCEGLAVAFERDAAGSTSPWCDYPDDVREWVNELLPLPIHAAYPQWMFRHPDGRQWIGYRAGAFIADRAIEVSGRTAAQLAESDYREILRLADVPLPPRKSTRWGMLASDLKRRTRGRPPT